MVPPDLKPQSVQYPETDGKPMAESDVHRILMNDLIVAAGHHFRDVPDVYVSGNLLLYFEEGNPEMVVSPDFFVVRGVRKGLRRIYKLWEEKKAPQIVIELTSRTTHLEDLGKKRAIYESLGVQEYFLFDPEGIRFQPQLRGFRLKDGLLQPDPAKVGPGGELILSSAVLGLDLSAKGSSIRWIDPATGQPLAIPEELYDEVDEERRKADAEKQRADAEKQRAEAEKQRAEAAEAEVARLREELARLKRKK